MNPNRISALLLKHWYVTINTVDRMLEIAFWPVVNLVIWGFTSLFVQSVNTGSNIIGIFLGGVILWFLFDRAQKDIAVYIIEDFWDHAVYNMYVSPVTEGEMIFSLVILGILRSILSFALLVLLALLAYQFNIFSVGIVILAAFIIPLIIFGWAFGIFNAGVVFRLGSRVGVLTWSLPFLIQPVSAVFYPISILPTSLQYIASILPLAHTFEGFRAALEGTFAADRFAYALILSIAYLLAAYLFFRYSVKRSKETGFLSKQ